MSIIDDMGAALEGVLEHRIAAATQDLSNRLRLVQADRNSLADSLVEAGRKIDELTAALEARPRPVAHLHIDQAFHAELEAELKRTCAELTEARDRLQTEVAHAKALAFELKHARAEVAKWKEVVARENRDLVNNINKCITLQDAIQPVRKERDEARAEVSRLKAGLQALMGTAP